MKLKNKKTGEILDDVKYIDTSLTTIEIHYLDNGVLRIKTEKDYHSFLQNWGDYKHPKEPLIKDEKIRKAVRAWADVVGEETFIVSHNMEHHDCCIYTGCLSDTATIDFGLDLNLKDGSYTIDELCGEEEE